MNYLLVVQVFVRTPGGSALRGNQQFVLADDLRLEAAFAVTGHVYVQCTGIGENGLGALAIAVIGRRSFGFGLAGHIAQVVAHLGAKRTLQHRLLELLKDVLKLGRRHRSGNQLFKRCGRELRLRRLVRYCARLRLAWHSCSLSTCYASHTKFMTGPRLLVLYGSPGKLSHIPFFQLVDLPSELIVLGQ